MAPCMRETLMMTLKMCDGDSGLVAIAMAPCMRETLIMIWNRWDGDSG